MRKRAGKIVLNGKFTSWVTERDELKRAVHAIHLHRYQVTARAPSCSGRRCGHVLLRDGLYRQQQQQAVWVSILYGTPLNHTARLQRIQHAQLGLSCTSILVHLYCLQMNFSNVHWLPTEWRIRFKLDTLTFKDLYTGRPPYLSDLLQHHEPTRSLCSSSSHQLLVPPQINIWISCFSVFCSKSLEFITYQYS